MLRVAIITTTNSLFPFSILKTARAWNPQVGSHTHIPARKTPQLFLPGPSWMWLLSLKVFPDVRKKDEQSSPYIHTPLMMTLHLVSFSICLEFLSSISSFPILPLFYPGLPPAVRSVSGLKGRGNYGLLGTGSALRAPRALAYLARKANLCQEGSLLGTVRWLLTTKAWGQKKL